MASGLPPIDQNVYAAALQGDPDAMAQLSAFINGPAPTPVQGPAPLAPQGLGQNVLQSLSGLEQQNYGPPQSFLGGLAGGFAHGLGAAGTRAQQTRAKLEADNQRRQQLADLANQQATSRYQNEGAATRRAITTAAMTQAGNQAKEADKQITVTPDLLAQAPKGSVAATLKPGTAIARSTWERSLTDQTPGAAAAAQQAAKPQGNADDVKAIADGVESGDLAPDLKGLYRMGGPVQAELARRGYHLKDARNDYFATQRNIASLNGPQQTRLRQAVDTAYSSLDVIDELNQKLERLVPRGSWAGLNRAKLAALANQPGEAGIVARQLEAQITDVVSELGNAYMGGNSPTDHALQLAEKNLSGNWSASQLSRLVDQARTNLRIRRNSIYNSSPVLPGQAVPAIPTAPVDPSSFWRP